jgi:hypothetical protein
MAPRGSADTRRDVERAFDRLLENDTRVLLAFCDGEPLRDELERDGYVARLERWPNLELAILPGRDHTLRPVWMHPHVHEAVDRALDVELGREWHPRAGAGERQVVV